MTEPSFGSANPLKDASIPRADKVSQEDLVRGELVEAIKTSARNFCLFEELGRVRRDLVGTSLQHEAEVGAYIRKALCDSVGAPAASIDSVLLGVRRLAGYEEVSAVFELRCKNRDGSVVLLVDHGEFPKIDPAGPGGRDLFVVSPGAALLEVSKVANSGLTHERIYLHPFEFAQQLELFVAPSAERRADSLFCSAASRALALRSATLRLTEPFETELVEKTPTKGVVAVRTSDANFVATFALSANYAFNVFCEAA